MNSKKSIISTLITVFVVGMLVFLGPANALNISVSVSQNTAQYDEVVTFTANIDIESLERVPVDNISAIITDKDNNTVSTCYFDINANKLSLCDSSFVNITKTKDTSSYEYDKLTGYGSSGNVDFGYGYGYGYNNANPSDVELEYNISWRTPSINAQSNTYNIYIYVNSQGNGNSESFSVINAGEINVSMQKPTASLSQTSYSIFDNETITLNATGSADPNGFNLTNYVLENNNLTFASSNNSVFNAGGFSVGNYTMQFYVENQYGIVSDKSNVSIEVISTQRPTLSYKLSSNQIFENETLTINASASNDLNNYSITSYNLYENSSLITSSSSPIISLSSLSVGPHVYMLNAQNQYGIVSTPDNFTINVISTQKPVANTSMDSYSFLENETITIDASNSYDLNNYNINRYIVYNGTQVLTNTTNNQFSLSLESGNYSFDLRVVNEYGIVSDSKSFDVEVVSIKPIVVLDQNNYRVIEGTNLEIDMSSSYDPFNRSINSYMITNGMSVIANSNSPLINISNLAEGNYTFGARVVNSEGTNSEVVTFNVEIVDGAPIVSVNENEIEIYEGNNITIDASGSYDRHGFNITSYEVLNNGQILYNGADSIISLNLPEGNYSLEVYAVNENGIRSNPVSVDVKVISNFYENSFDFNVNSYIDNGKIKFDITTNKFFDDKKVKIKPQLQCLGAKFTYKDEFMSNRLILSQGKTWELEVDRNDFNLKVPYDSSCTFNAILFDENNNQITLSESVTFTYEKVLDNDNNGDAGEITIDQGEDIINYLTASFTGDFDTGFNSIGFDVRNTQSYPIKVEMKITVPEMDFEYYEDIKVGSNSKSNVLIPFYINENMEKGTYPIRFSYRINDEGDIRVKYGNLIIQ